MRYGPKLTPCREYDSRKNVTAARFTAIRQHRAQRAAGRLRSDGNAGSADDRGSAGMQVGRRLPGARDHVVAMGQGRGG